MSARPGRNSRRPFCSRYLAAAGFSWQLGFVVGPAAGAALLGTGPNALWLAAAALCGLAALAALRLDANLPDAVRLTPRRPR